MVDTEVPVAGALVEVGFVLEEGGFNAELVERFNREGSRLRLRCCDDESVYTNLSFWAIKQPTKPTA